MLNFIKKYWSHAAISLLGGFGIGYVSFVSPSLFEITPDRIGCEQPIHWRLGNVDERFPLNTKEFRKSAFEAERIWEDAIGKELFVLDDTSPFEVYTVFDERQQMTYEAKNLEGSINNYKQEAALLESQYASLKNQYDQKEMELSNLEKELEAERKDYEKDVRKWNDSSRTSYDQYEKLLKKEKNLKKLQDRFEKEIKNFNQLTSRVNASADNINAKTNQVNEKIKTYRDKYGEPAPFVQGLYHPPLDKIEIFQFEEREDLRMVLAHEFGHALGIFEHVSDPEALMNAMMDRQNIENPKLEQSDIDAYDSICPLREFSKSEKLKRYLIFTPWKEMRLGEILNILKS